MSSIPSDVKMMQNNNNNANQVETKVFSFGDQRYNVRTISKAGVMWICAKDLHEPLGVQPRSIRKSVASIPDRNHVAVLQVPVLSNVTRVNFITQTGLIWVIGKSNSSKPIVLKFKWWIAQVIDGLIRSGHVRYGRPQLEHGVLLNKLRQTADFCEEIDGLDDDTRFVLRDLAVSNTVSQFSTAQGVQIKYSITISDRLLKKHRCNALTIKEHRIKIGRACTPVYKSNNNGRKPPQRKQKCNGAWFDVNCYYEKDYVNYLDNVIVTYLNNLKI